MALPKQKIAVVPESEDKLSQIVRKLLREGDAFGVLPTPVDRLLAVARIKSIESIPDESFLATLSDQTQSFFKGAWQKLRGIADLREDVNYVPKDTHIGRQLFTQCHELGHQTIPWHRVDAAYLDDSESLSADAKAIFEREANYFSAQTVFQIDRFRTMARDYRPSFNAVFALAELYGASKQATAWRFVEDQDETLALLQYYPTGAIDAQGHSSFQLWRSVGSPSFNRRIDGIDIPIMLRAGHPWLMAYQKNQVCDGYEKITVDSHAIPFEWQAWWNGYALMVMLRRRPILRLVGDALRPIRKR